MPGISSISVNLLGQMGVVDYNKDILGPRDILEKIESLGFDALLDDSIEKSSASQLESLERVKEIQKWRNAFYYSSLLAIPVSCLSMIVPLVAPDFMTMTLIPGLRLGDLLMLLLTIPLQFVVGRVFYAAAYKSLRHGTYTMDVLLTLGTTVAFFFSFLSMTYAVLSLGKVPAQVFFETSATLICFVSWGRYLENVAKGNTTSALSKLISLAPSHAIVLTPSSENTLSFNEKIISYNLIQENDLLKVKPGEKIPTDGEIEFGSTTVDESLITGEPFPVTKGVKSIVIGGTLNLTASILFYSYKKLKIKKTLKHLLRALFTYELKE
jgi:Cu+-exporting ATPase